MVLREVQGSGGHDMFRKPSWINNNTKKHGTFTTVSFCSCLCGDISFFSSVDGEKEYVNNC